MITSRRLKGIEIIVGTEKYIVDKVSIKNKIVTLHVKLPLSKRNKSGKGEIELSGENLKHFEGIIKNLT